MSVCLWRSRTSGRDKAQVMRQRRVVDNSVCDHFRRSVLYYDITIMLDFLVVDCLISEQNSLTADVGFRAVCVPKSREWENSGIEGRERDRPAGRDVEIRRER